MLKPYPFCGGEAEIFVARHESYGYWPEELAIRCTNCHVRMPGVVVENRDAATKKLIKKWNLRTVTKS